MSDPVTGWHGEHESVDWLAGNGDAGDVIILRGMDAWGYESFIAVPRASAVRMAVEILRHFGHLPPAGGSQ